MGKKKKTIFIESLLIAGITIFGFANCSQAQDTNPLRPTLPPDGLALEALREAQSGPLEAQLSCIYNSMALRGPAPRFPKCPKVNDCNAFRDAYKKYIDTNEANILDQLQSRLNAVRNLQCEADLGGYGNRSCQQYAQTLDSIQFQMSAWNCAFTDIRKYALDKFKDCQALAAKAVCDVINPPLDSIKIIPSQNIRDGDFTVDEDEEISRVEDGELIIEE